MEGYDWDLSSREEDSHLVSLQGQSDHTRWAATNGAAVVGFMLKQSESIAAGMT